MTKVTIVYNEKLLSFLTEGLFSLCQFPKKNVILINKVPYLHNYFVVF